MRMPRWLDRAQVVRVLRRVLNVMLWGLAVDIFEAAHERWKKRRERQERRP